MAMPRTMAVGRWTLVALALVAVGCEPEAPPPTAPAPSAAAAPAPGAAAPTATLGPVKVLGSGPYVTEGSEGNTAKVEAEAGEQIQWTIQGGTITQGETSETVVYTAGTGSGKVLVTCHLRSASGAERIGSITQERVAPGVLASFEAIPPVATMGNPATLAWTAQDIKTLVLEPGGQDVSKQGSLEVTVPETTTYVLTATNLAGTPVKKEVTLKVVPKPEIKGFAATGGVRLGQTATFTAEFAHGKAELRDGSQVLGASDTSPLVVRVAPREGMTLTLTVTNEAGTTVSQPWSFLTKGKN